MMSITNRSRILAMILVIGMILSLVPVMAAASNDYSVGYAKITYPTGGSKLYTVSTNYFDGNGAKAAGSVLVKITNPNGDMFYANMFSATTTAPIEFSLQMADTDVEGKYSIEYTSATMGDKNKAFFYFYKDEAVALAAFNNDVKGKAFTSLEMQLKLAMMEDSMPVYAKYMLNKESELPEDFLADVMTAIQTEGITYTGDDGVLATEVDTATVLHMFNEVENNSTKSYIDKLLCDDEVIDAIGDMSSSNIDKTLKKCKNASATTKALIGAKMRDGGYGNYTESTLPSRLVRAINDIITDSDNSGGSTGGSSTVTGGGSGSGSGSGSGTGGYVPGTKYVTAVFTDLDTTAYWWLIQPLQALYSAGYINGRTENTFAPGESITRAEFLKILLMELDLANTQSNVAFTDVQTTDWFYKYVASGAALGIVNGRSATEFAPNDLITREEIAVMTMRAVRVKNISLGTTGNSTAFTDQDSIADYAVSDIAALKEAGILSGRDTGAFDPKANATRAEAVKILYGVYVKK